MMQPSASTAASTARTAGRSPRPLQSPPLTDSKPVLPPVETPEGAPDLGFLIAFEEPGAPDGWASGIVKAVEDGVDGRHFTIDTKAGKREVPRELVFYWWPLD